MSFIDFPDNGGKSGIVQAVFLSSVKSIDCKTEPINSPERKCAIVCGLSIKFMSGVAGSVRLALFTAYEDFCIGPNILIDFSMTSNASLIDN